AVRAADSLRPLAALVRRLHVDLPGELAQELVLDDLLIKFRVLSAPALARVIHEEFALGDAGRAERIRFDDVRPGLEKASVDVADHRGLGERKDVAVVEQTFGRILEALATHVRLGHSVGADGRANRPVENDDALAE